MLNPSHSTLMKRALIEESYPGVWFGSIPETKYVWALGETEKLCRVGVSIVLTKWVNKGRPVSMTIANAKDIAKLAYIEYETAQVYGIISARPSLKRSEYYVATCRPGAKHLMIFEGVRYPDEIHLWCTEDPSITTYSFNQKGALQACALAAALKFNAKVEEVDIMISIDNSRGFLSAWS